MRLLFLFLIVLGLHTLCISQVYRVGVTNMDQIMSSLVLDEQVLAINEISIENPKLNRYRSVKGSPFLYSGVGHGKLKTAHGETIDNLSLIYDLYSSDLFCIKGNTAIVLNKDLVEEISLLIDGKQIKLKRIGNNGISKYYAVLFEDSELSLLKEPKVKIVEGKNVGIIKVDPKFLTGSSYYLLTKARRKNLQYIKLKKKKFLNDLPSKRAKTCKNFVKENKLKLRSEEDYINLLSQSSPGD